jgi:hypothetical protein
LSISISYAGVRLKVDDATSIILQAKCRCLPSPRPLGGEGGRLRPREGAISRGGQAPDICLAIVLHRKEVCGALRRIARRLLLPLPGHPCRPSGGWDGKYSCFAWKVICMTSSTFNRTHSYEHGAYSYKRETGSSPLRQKVGFYFLTPSINPKMLSSSFQGKHGKKNLAGQAGG